MPETLKDGGLLVNPFDKLSIIKAITDFELNKDKRIRLGKKAHINSLKYSWKNTAKETYSLLYQTYKEVY